MKKILLLFVVVSVANTAFSQIGINNDDPKATLHVKGQKDTIPFLIDDSKEKEILQVTKDGKVGIGGKTSDSDLHVTTKGAIRIEGMKDQSFNAEEYNRVLVTNEAGKVAHLPLGIFETDLPNIRTIKYHWHHAELSGTAAEVRTKTTTTLGDIRVRYSPASNSELNWGYIQIQFLKPNYYACYWEKMGAGTLVTDYTNKPYKQAGEVARYFQGKDRGYPNINEAESAWINFRAMGGSSAEQVKDNYNPGNRDIITAILVLNNSKHIYRLNFVANGKINATADVPAVNGSITTFIEQLTGHEYK